MTGQLARLCEFCGGPIPEGSRRDAVTCSQPCRQKRNRWRVGRAPEPSRGSVAGRSRRDGSPPGERDGSAPGVRDGCADCAAAVSDGYDACDTHAGAAAPRADRPLRLAYAAPPYPNLSRRYYKREEVDHRELIERLDREYDGWALSTSSAALPMVLKLCPDTVRVCVWLRRPRAGRCWEPVIVKSARKITSNRDTHLIPPDVLDDPSVFRGYPGRIIGMKSPAFCEWVFRLMGAQLGDSLDDVFPGTGAVSRAWRLFQAPASERPKTAKPSRLEEKLAPRDRRDGSRKRTSSAKPAKSSPPAKPATKRAGGKGGRPTPRRKWDVRRCPEHKRGPQGATGSAIWHAEQYSCGCWWERETIDGRAGQLLQKLPDQREERAVCKAKHAERPGIECELPAGHLSRHGVMLRSKRGERWAVATHTVTWANDGARLDVPAEPSRRASRKRRPAPAPDLPASATDAELRELRQFEARTAEQRRALELETSRAAETLDPSRGDRREGAA